MVIAYVSTRPLPLKLDQGFVNLCVIYSVQIKSMHARTPKCRNSEFRNSDKILSGKVNNFEKVIFGFRKKCMAFLNSLMFIPDHTFINFWEIVHPPSNYYKRSLVLLVGYLYLKGS